MISSLLLGFSHLTLAECSDIDAKLSADSAAQVYVNGLAATNRVAAQSAVTFKRALIIKKHLPSKRKEVASYIEAGNLYYTVYSLVNSQCIASTIKSTNGKH
ncbi:hypothetical protein [Marinomonas transparens]|uniref:Uncharacterized protein n=1 Tax=Marinomonas transparens TaxID=2795388 RepID=A0A934N4D9_9GAMM|nr:hypothetical protein [Marinomonas transparens]MBJ7539978.1 hypothetical protein [Marinomonas transparens]